MKKKLLTDQQILNTIDTVINGLRDIQMSIMMKQESIDWTDHADAYDLDHEVIDDEPITYLSPHDGPWLYPTGQKMEMPINTPFDTNPFNTHRKENTDDEHKDIRNC